MKNKIKGGFFAYLLIFAGIIFTVVITCAALLILSPSMELFGYSFVVNKTEVVVGDITVGDSKVFLNNLPINKIVIDYTPGNIKDKLYENAHFNVDIYQDLDREMFNVIFENSLRGFTNKLDYKKTTVTDNYDALTQTLTYTITEPIIDLYLSKQFNITVRFPKNYNSSDIDMVINTRTGSISAGNNVTRGTLNLKSITANTISGDLTLRERCSINGGAISLKTNTGDLQVSDQNNNAMKLLRPNINLETQSGAFRVGKLAGNVTLKSNKSTIVCDEIEGNLTLDSITGSLNAATISGNFSATENVKSTNIILSNVKGETLLPNSDHTDIIIQKTFDRVLIKTKYGKIKINEIADEAVLETESGEIEFYANTTKPVEAKTTTGTINAKYNSIATTHSLQSTKGTINAKFNTGLNAKIVVNTTGEIRKSWNTSYVGRTNLVETLGDATTAEIIRVLTINSEKGKVNLIEEAIA